jgi:hypothetical protein
VECLTFHAVAQHDVKDLTIDHLAFVGLLRDQLQWIAQLLEA